MKISKLSDKILGGGCVAELASNENALKIDKKKIIEIFEDKGIILFKKINLDKNTMVKFTNQFTQQYANDATKNTRPKPAPPPKNKLPTSIVKRDQNTIRIGHDKAMVT